MSGKSVQPGLVASAAFNTINDRGLNLRQTALRLRYDYGVDFSHPDLILSPYDRPHKQSLSLFDLSSEIIGEIGSYLAPLWLLQFSTTCRTLNDIFSFKKGNVHWYNALPPSVWQQMERFQDEEELKVHILAKQFPREMMQVWFPDHYSYDSRPTHSQNLPVAIPHHSGYFMSAGFTSSPQIPYTGTNWALYYPPIGPVQAHAYVGAVTNEPTFVASRARKTLLGSKYDCDFNYRREIVGCLKQPNTCIICLKGRNPDGSIVRAKCWKLTFCFTCLEEYQIGLTGTAETTVLRSAPILQGDLQTLGPDSRYRLTRMRKHFRPHLNKVALRATGYSFDMIHLLWKMMCQEKKHWKLQHSALEARRRAVRFRIVAAAEALWEGRDPFPVKAANLDAGTVQSIPYPGMRNATKYAVFRNRFAPAHKLKGFLFSPAALSDTPSQLAYRPEQNWLLDPTMKIRTNQQFADVDDDWVSSKASLMLNNLTNWQHPRFSMQGGRVDSWKQAAMSWHLARLERELETGAVYGATYVTGGMSQAGMDRNIRRLRSLLGCVDGLQELPSLPDRGTNMTPEEYQQYLHGVEIFRHREQLERGRQKIFNKIVRETCSSCPESAMLFFPIGLEGLCKHCLECHPRLFWEGDFHCLG
ncbi:hypothetical protein GP486_003015 [Trichoglossum hirsutum]|uniref:F-box domain-containing protein n=1 Tax=Trichoglossum hirsutum TaxID=265104 RepID=A0A9P8RR68_9PEZI|nr:hypothetical protein GP486_003015 [Trichoglossum hirsutum]